MFWAKSFHEKEVKPSFKTREKARESFLSLSLSPPKLYLTFVQAQRCSYSGVGLLAGVGGTSLPFSSFFPLLALSLPVLAEMLCALGLLEPPLSSCSIGTPGCGGERFWSRRVFWSSEVSRLLELGFDGVVFSLDLR